MHLVEHNEQRHSYILTNSHRINISPIKIRVLFSEYHLKFPNIYSPCLLAIVHLILFIRNDGEIHK